MVVVPFLKKKQKINKKKQRKKKLRTAIDRLLFYKISDMK
jgi:hypothetical protein